MRIYVAGSSNEMPRVVAAMVLARESGHEITYDWVSEILKVGNANPRTASRTQRADWAWTDIAGVEECDVLWLLAPNVGHGRGAFVELGFAIATLKTIVISGPACHESIFNAIGYECPTDELGLTLINKIARQSRFARG